jgi:nitroimidazol reductase NimA-like FMN-containing flavoprotein (pyridoxamine 5'-phosphate oxidase superfamily)
MTLGTADEDGRPWVSPFFYASREYTEFYWISSPEVTHSRNLARRPQVSMVIFDSQVPAGAGEAVYMTATAEELTGADLDRGVAIYPGPPERAFDHRTTVTL